MAKLRDRLSERDHRILKFLWRWKFVSSAALFYKFYPTMKSTTAYAKLQKVRTRKYVKNVRLDFDPDGAVWTLTEKGFQVVKRNLNELENAYYKSATVDHDFLCSAIHLGNWLAGTPENGRVFSEQEIKSYHKEFYPYWLPKIESHRPDGYWHFTGPEGSQTFALEVETTQKAKSRYEKVRAAYQYASSISNVVWVVPSKPSAKTILHEMTRRGHLENQKHSFLLIKDVLDKNWDSKFIAGPLSGNSLANVVDSISVKSRGGAGVGPIHRLLINTKLYAVNSDDYLNRLKSKTID